MADLKSCFGQIGLLDVQTYIQSGNVVFRTNILENSTLVNDLSALMLKEFGLDVAVAVFKNSEWKGIIEAAPEWWGRDITWKHNILIMTKEVDIAHMVAQIGVLEPHIEAIAAGERVIYQSISVENFSRATSGRLASLPIYKSMTVRNYNTATKIRGLLT